MVDYAEDVSSEGDTVLLRYVPCVLGADVIKTSSRPLTSGTRGRPLMLSSLNVCSRRRSPDAVVQG